MGRRQEDTSLSRGEYPADDASGGFSVEARDVTFHYGNLTVLDEVSITVPRGEFVAIVGPSGCGKSTLLNILAGFVTPTSGRVSVENHPPGSPRVNRGMVFQEYALFPWQTAWRNVAFPLELTEMSKEQRHKKASRLLTTVGLESFTDAYPHQLSGGMKQRVAIARALATDPAILLMDEPLGALDALTRESLMELIDAVWRRTQQTVIYITHNVAEAVYLGDRVVVFSPGPAAKIKEVLPIDLPRPRDRLSEEAVEYQRRITAMVAG